MGRRGFDTCFCTYGRTVNLVDNAIRHNNSGGFVHVITSHDDGQAVVTVRNSGDTIPSGEVDRLFEPFQRLASHRCGGLHIERSRLCHRPVDRARTRRRLELPPGTQAADQCSRAMVASLRTGQYSPT
jgi:light-regulated signal transduction histidine kinase (bacteriophytochrome)